MNRVDIFANQALDSIIERGLSELDGVHFTVHHHLGGNGNKGFCLNSDIWPEGNVGYIIYCNDTRLEQIKELLVKIKEEFPVIGLHSFVTQGAQELV